MEICLLGQYHSLISSFRFLGQILVLEEKKKKKEKQLYREVMNFLKDTGMD